MTQGKRHCRFPTTQRMLPGYVSVVWPLVHLADRQALKHRVVVAQQRVVIGLRTCGTRARIHAVQTTQPHAAPVLDIAPMLEMTLMTETPLHWLTIIELAQRIRHGT